MEQNKDFIERVRCPIPTRELERRWRLVREAMGKQGIDLLVMQNDNMFLGGYVRYFTDIPVEHAYPVSVLFHADGEMTTITSSPPEKPLYPEWAARGVTQRLGIPYFRSLDFTKNFDAEAMVKIIKDKKYQTVGFVNLGLINTALYSYLTENLSGVQFVDATDLVDEIKAVKSEDELVLIRKAAQIHDYVVAAVPSILRPGIYEFELRNEIKRLLISQGSEEQLIKLGSAPYGQRTPFLDTFFQNRQIKQGDTVEILIECSGAGGYYSEIQRGWSLGEPHEDTLKAWELSYDVQRYTASLLKPGTTPAEVANQVNEYLISIGLPAESRIIGHGQGYDLVERPGLSAAETMKIQANMSFGIHYTVAHGQGVGTPTDNYLVTENGTERLHKTPQKLFII